MKPKPYQQFKPENPDIAGLRKAVAAAASVHKYLFERGDKWPHELSDAAFEVWNQLERALTLKEKENSF